VSLTLWYDKYKRTKLTTPEKTPVKTNIFLDKPPQLYRKLKRAATNNKDEERLNTVFCFPVIPKYNIPSPIIKKSTGTENFLRRIA
jgi:hypothetical protein